MNDDITAEDIFAAIGIIVARLLKPDQHLTLHEIISALHAMGEDPHAPATRACCARAIRMLSQQMH
ncbi:hypothetical protein [Pantoea sp. SORGH_AS_0659]|uniref:hypothetical protein n=1 Tax=Pantoea sp. SORGH_AS_0659 TaxID=3062597 RepID=UPI0028632865|nr:hypothetical protein [Pantoea sp. SORGH_AS_0659]MDR6352547.1 hypothetical protein [Pantoea sp. SORGH_AS_0659]